MIEAILAIFGILIAGAFTAAILGAAAWWVLFLYNEAKDTGMLPWLSKK